MKKRWISLSLTIILVLVFSMTLAAKTGIDTAKPVKIYGYLLGAAPPGMPEVMAGLNKKLKKDLNATMEINYIGWGDMQSKYPLILASGEDVDWIYTANWAFYSQEAAKGAFLEMKADMLKKYMPKHYAATNKVAWREARINSKVYMIPTSTPDRKVGCVIIRGDLRKKYGIPAIKKFSDLVPYFEAIKKNEPGMLPMNLDNTFDMGKVMGALYYELGPFWQDVMLNTSGGSGLYFDHEDPEGNLYMMTEEPVVSVMKKAAKTMKSWYEKGYYNKDAFANKVRSKDAFDQGKSAVGFGNTQDIQSNLANAKAKGWEIEIIPTVSVKGHYPADPYINNGLAIAARSKNPERTMAAMDLIMENPAYNYLVYFGIQGKNYIIKNGKVDLPSGVTADKNTYPPDAAGFWFTNKDQFKPLAAWDDNYIKLRQNVKGMLTPNVFAAFAPDTNLIKTEIANLNQTVLQYYNPISVGMVDDVDAAFANLEAKLKAAGVERVKAELNKQIKVYLEAMK